MDLPTSTPAVTGAAARSLAGKRVLVTGATSGIGRAVAEAFGRAGATVTVSGRDQARGREVRDAIDGQARFVAADLARFDEVERLAAEAGDVDVLVNNAGAVPFAATSETTRDLFDATIAVNVRAPFFLTAAIAPRMADNGGGSIVNVSTMVAELGLAGTALYGASKAALILLTKAWAAEYSGRGVRVNAVSPGPTRTPGAEQMGGALDQLAATVPLKRPATVEEVASVILFLASDEASYVTGATFAVDGGRTAT
jgi:NAD(P)-dependent dehydrogenase (short-subunit alcohol dehydrogenase family)